MKKIFDFVEAQLRRFHSVTTVVKNNKEYEELVDKITMNIISILEDELKKAKK